MNFNYRKFIILKKVWINIESLNKIKKFEKKINKIKIIFYLD
jgi:hypothetical protein